MKTLDGKDNGLESIIKVEEEEFQVTPASGHESIIKEEEFQVNHVSLRELAVEMYDCLKSVVVPVKDYRKSSTPVPYQENIFLVEKTKRIRRLWHEGPYFCDHCEKVCPSRPAVASHLKFRHFKPGPFHCDLCPSSLREKYMIANHMRACHLGIKMHLCRICSFKTALKGGLNRHMKLIHGEKTPCPICGKLVAVVALHIKSAHSDPKVTCEICCRIFKSDTLKRHMLRIHGDQEPKGSMKRQRVSCSVCQKEYFRHNHLQRHWKEAHSATHGELEGIRLTRPKTVSRNGPFTCDYCGSLTMDRRDFRKHLVNHHIIRDPPLVCKICDAFFTTKSAFISHRKRLHKKVRSDTYACDICGFVTNQKGYIAKHVLTHMTNKTECPICHKFVTVINIHLQGHKTKTCQLCKKVMNARSMPSHMKQHKKAQQCKHCDASFIPTEMRKHMIAAHTEGKIFECHCGSIFKNIEGLRRHKKSHGVKNIPCKDCDLMFNMQTALMQHVKQRHPESYKNRDNKRDTKSATKRSKIK